MSSMLRCGDERDRREFLRGVVRGLILGGIGFVAARLVAVRGKSGRVRRRGTLPKRLTCVSRGICPGCPQVSGCQLPQADLARRAGRT